MDNVSYEEKYATEKYGYNVSILILAGQCFLLN